MNLEIESSRPKDDVYDQVVVVMDNIIESVIQLEENVGEVNHQNKQTVEDIDEGKERVTKIVICQR